MAVWDTGATNSMITQAVVDQCSLLSIGITDINHALGTAKDVEEFLVDIGLPNGVKRPGLRVAKAVLPHGHVLIGMDIISQGDFAVTHPRSNTKFSFRIPSKANIDFVAEDRKAALPGMQSKSPKRKRK